MSVSNYENLSRQIQEKILHAGNCTQVHNGHNPEGILYFI